MQPATTAGITISRIDVHAPLSAECADERVIFNGFRNKFCLHRTPTIPNLREKHVTLFPMKVHSQAGDGTCGTPVAQTISGRTPSRFSWGACTPSWLRTPGMPWGTSGATSHSSSAMSSYLRSIVTSLVLYYDRSVEAVRVWASGLYPPADVTVAGGPYPQCRTKRASDLCTSGLRRLLWGFHCQHLTK